MNETWPEDRPRNLAVVVGIGEYPLDGPLENAPNDAKDVGALLKNEYGFEFDEWLLIDARADLDTIRKAVRDSLRSADRHSRWLFYFAGHGKKEGQQGYLVPAGQSLSSPAQQCLSLHWLLRQCLQSDCAETLMVVDACYAGRALVPPSWLDPENSEYQGVRQLIAAGGLDQVVWDSGGDGHSLFTQCLLDALCGWEGIHSAGDGSIGFYRLIDHLREEVARRLKAMGQDADRQIVVGGDLTGNRSQEFCIRPVFERIPPQAVADSRSDDQTRRLRSLAVIAKSYRQHSTLNLKLVRRLLLRGLPRGSVADFLKSKKAWEHRLEFLAGPIQGEEFRGHLAPALGELAKLSREGRDPIAEALLHLALRDDSVQVRDQSRRSLASMPPSAWGKSVQRLQSWLASSPESEFQGRIRDLLSVLPLLRPWTDRTQALARRWRLSCGRGWRWVAGHPFRRRLAIALALVPILFYGFMLDRYYVSLDGWRVVLRVGHPAWSSLPLIGSIRVFTEYTRTDLRDARSAEDEALRGSWSARAPDGSLAWGRQLFEQLKPAPAGLALWRMGDREAAWSRLSEGFDDAEALKAAAYLAQLHPEEASSLSRILIQAVIDSSAPDIRSTAQEKLHREAVAALTAASQAGIEHLRSALEWANSELNEAEGQDALELSLAIGILAGDNEQALGPAVRRLAALLQAGIGDSRLERRLVERLHELAGRAPRLLADRSSWISSSLLDAHPESRILYFALAELLIPVEPENGGELRRAILAVLKSGAEPVAIRAAAASALSRLAEARPEDKELIGLLWSLARSPEPELRLEACESLIDRADAKGQGMLLRALAPVANQGGNADLALRAVRLLERLDKLEGASHRLTALAEAAQQPSPAVAREAIREIARLGRQGRAAVSLVETALRQGLQSPNPHLRLESALGLAQLADRVTGAMEPAYWEIALQPGPNAGRLWDAQLMAQGVAEGTTESIAAAVRGLAPLLIEGDSWGGYRCGEFLEALLKAKPQALPRLVAVWTELMADQEQDLDPYSSAFEQGLRRMPSGSNEAMPAALGILLGQSKSDRPEVRQASAALIGLTVRGVAYGLRRRDLEDKALTPVGLTATRSLILLLADPDARVRLTAAYWLGEIGASVDGASRLCWEDLLRCFEAGEFPLRQACGLALSRLYPGSQAAPPPLAPRLAALLEADHPELRMAAAQCLTRWGKGMQAEGSAAVQALRRSLQESDTSLRLAKASALAVVGGGDSDVVQEVLDLVGSSLASSDSHERRQAQMLLRDLGETHPAAAPAALQLLRAGGSDEPGAAGKTRWEDSLTRLVAVRDIGWSDARSARSALQVLAEALAAPNQDTRRNAISNGIRPLVCRYPGLADEVLIILERQAQAGILAGLAHGEAALREHLSSTFLDCWVEAAAVRAVVEGPPTLQPWIASPASGDRRLGRLALLRATAKRPALLPEMREMLRRTGRSVRPHVRLCTAQANEGLALLEKLQAGSPEEFNRLLDWLPDRSLAQELVGIRGRQDSHCLLPTQ